MELATTLQGQTVRVGIRQTGANPNYWYPLGWAEQLKPGQVMAAKVWKQELAVYRDVQGQLHAVQDFCPHKGVALHQGKVMGDNLACRYHGWEFNGEGTCVSIPYWTEGQKLPCAQVRSFPIQERYNLIWVFPGEPDLAEQVSIPFAREYDQSGWLALRVSAKFAAHFSICNENSMDVFHGFLHENLQGWFDPKLLRLQETEDSVTAQYQVSYRGRLAKLLGLTSDAEAVTTRVVSVSYQYPHYVSHMEGTSALYLMRLPVDETESRSFALFFFKVPFPNWLLKTLQPLLARLLPPLVLYRFLDQDIEMMESEQRNYLAHPERRYVEVNPAIIAVQRLIQRQYERCIQKDHSPRGHSPTKETVSTV
jgi:renierapurpurin 18,18'-hydroxylase